VRWPSSTYHELQLSSKGSFTSDVVHCIQHLTLMHLHRICCCRPMCCIALWRHVALCPVRRSFKTCLNWSCVIMVANGLCLFDVHVFTKYIYRWDGWGHSEQLAWVYNRGLRVPPAQWALGPGEGQWQSPSESYNFYLTDSRHTVMQRMGKCAIFYILCFISAYCLLLDKMSWFISKKWDGRPTEINCSSQSQIITGACISMWSTTTKKWRSNARLLIYC